MPKKRRRALLAAALLLVAAPCGLFLDGRSRQAARLSAKFAELDAAEPGWRLADLHGARNARLPPDEANAAAQGLAAVALAPRLTPLHPIPILQLDPLIAEFGKPDNAPPDLGVVAKAEAELACFASSLAVVRRVRDLPNGGLPRADFEPDVFDMRYVKEQQFQSAADLLALDAAVLACRGKSAESLLSCRGVLNVARGGYGDEPGLMSQTWRAGTASRAAKSVERTLSRAADGPPELLAELQASFAAERAFPRLETSRGGERGWVVLAIEQVESGAIPFNPYNGGWAPTWDRKAFTLILRKSAAEAKLVALDHFDRLAEAERLPDPARLDAANKLDPGPSSPVLVPTARNIVRHMLLGGCAQVNRAESALRARLGCAEVALACERFRLSTGHFPAALAELTPDILEAVPMDPYTGRPLMLRRDESGLTVYSTGPDKADDGGETLSERGAAGTDLGFRLWGANLRRPAANTPDKGGGR